LLLEIKANSSENYRKAYLLLEAKNSTCSPIIFHETTRKGIGLCCVSIQEITISASSLSPKLSLFAHFISKVNREEIGRKSTLYNRLQKRRTNNSTS
jgi:hypothetical protein